MLDDGGHTDLHVIKLHGTTHKDMSACKMVTSKLCRVVILYDSYARCFHWRKLGIGYTGSLLFFAICFCFVYLTRKYFLY